MSGKFMTTKKIVISAITLMLIASQLTGCACGSSSEFLNMYERQQEIVIEIAEPINQEQGTERSYEWTELAYLKTYPEFRDIFDDAIGVINQGQNGKNGVVYVDPSTKAHTNNSTLRYAFANQKFLDKCWNNTDTMKVLISAVKSNFVDIETDSVARVAVLNTYFNILPDAEPNYFNGNQTLTRGEFLAALYRAETPVAAISEDSFFKNLVDPSGSDETTLYANQMLNYSYLTTADESLNASTYAGKISRAEAIYTLVQRYYLDEYNSVTSKESAYSDTKNGGDIASEEGFNKTDKKYGKAYELSYAINHERAGLPENLYKAMVVAKRHSLISGTESRWSDGITKSEFIDLVARVYEDLGTTYSADRGASKGSVVDNTNPNEGGNGDTGSDTNQGTIESKFHIDEEDYYYDSDGKLQYTNELMEFVKSFDHFRSLEYIEIARVIETNGFENIFELGKVFGDIQGTLTIELSSEITAEALIKSALSNFTADKDTEDEVNGSGGEVAITDKDSNRGGSVEDEIVSEEDFVTPDTPVAKDEVKEDEKVVITWGENNQYTFTDIQKNMYVTESVNLRQGPSTEYEKTGNVPKGEKIYVVSKCNEVDWYMVYYMRATHFVTAKYISETAPIVATPTPKPTVTQAPTKPTATPKPQPTEAPKPTGTVKVPEVVVVDGKEGTMYNGSFVPSTEGEYINGYLVLEGLEEFTGEIPMNNIQEIRAWIQKYPDAGKSFDSDGNVYIHIATPDGGELEGDIEINFN